MRLWIARKLLPKNYKIIKIVLPLRDDNLEYRTGPAQPAE